MAGKFPEKITADTFPAAWQQADKRLRRAKKGSLIYRTGALLTFPVFAILVQLPVLRELENRGVGIAGLLLEKIPQLLTLWDQFHGIFFQNVQTDPELALAWGKFLYLLPLVAGLVPVLPLLFLYHPRKQKLPEAGTPLEQAEALVTLLQDAKKRARDVSLTRYLSGMVVAILSSCLVLFDYYTPLDGPSRADMILSEVFPVPHMYFVGVPLMMLAVLLLMALFWLAALPLNGLLRLFSLNPVSKKVLEAAEAWKQECKAQASPQEPQSPPSSEKQV